ncbi:MAG: OmpA family protein [Bacteroidota bacterium]
MIRITLPIICLLGLFIGSSCVSQDQYNDAQYRVDSLYNQLIMEQRLNDQLQHYIETIYYEKVEPNWSSSIDLPVSKESAQTVETEDLNALPEISSPEALQAESTNTRSDARLSKPKEDPEQPKIPAFLLKEEIHFAKNQTNLDETSLNLIAKVARAFKNRKDYLITIEGHTDNSESMPEGGKSSHWELSTERAAVVAKQLIANGVSPHLLRISGRGMFLPHASNHTVVGQEKNRRAEIILSPKKQ